MKQIYSLIVIILISLAVSIPQQSNAQTPNKMSYQAVIRDANNLLVTNTSVGMQISIIESMIGGTIVYSEMHTTTTNANGLISIEIGTGSTSDVFSSISWGENMFFLKTETDPTGGTNYTITGISQLMSVPYALHSKTADSISGTITESQISDLTHIVDTKLDENTVDSFVSNNGYLSSFTEIDGSITNELQAISISNDTIFLSDGGFVKLPANTPFSGNFTDLMNIPTGISDGDDDTQLSETQVDAFTMNNGFLTAEIDGSATNELQAISISNDTIFLSDGGFVILPAIATFSGNFNDLMNIPTGLADGDDDTQLNDSDISSMGYIKNSDDNDADSTNEMNTGVVLNGNNLEITDGAGTITTDLSSLSSGGSGNWTTTGNNINNSNSGNVGIGIPTPTSLLAVGSTDTNSVVSIGHFGHFNEPYAAELIFSENLTYNGLCGIKFQLNGATDNLHLIGGCSQPDTIARFSRVGQSNIKTLRVGDNLLLNSSSKLTVDGDIQVNGNINVTGSISKASGTFKIDHPLDPENKYLIHSFVESPEMMNIFSGNITTDANGFATVQMPDYFEAANKDFRYQLTVIGTFAQAIIKEKINANVFLIQTNQPNIEVSWTVTSVRADKYAKKYPIIPEVDKEVKGSYIHPELYNKGQEKSEDYIKTKLLEKENTKSNDADTK